MVHLIFSQDKRKKLELVPFIYEGYNLKAFTIIFLPFSKFKIYVTYHKVHPFTLYRSVVNISTEV